MSKFSTSSRSGVFVDRRAPKVEFSLRLWMQKATAGAAKRAPDRNGRDLDDIAKRVGTLLEVFLRDHPDPEQAEIRGFPGGHLCRCTGYVAIVAAAPDAAKTPREAREHA
jgi:hypothetical protein